MNEKSDLLKEAIADAKAVKETALANAKIALEEAFAPRIHNMLSTKLSEDLYEDEMNMDMDAEAEIEAPMEEPSVVVDGEKYVKADDAEGAEIDVDMDAAPDMDMGEEPINDDMALEDGMMNDADEDPTDLNSGVEEDLELEAIIRELEEDLNEEELTEEELAEDAHNSDAADSTDAKGNDLMAEPKEMKNEEFNIDEIIEEILSEEDKEEEPKDKVEEGEDHDDKESKEKVEEMTEELTEAYDTIESLRDTINEVNLLNAKLLYTNKLFRNFELSESQKMTVIENFDRAGNTREVKLVFSTLAENFTVPVKKRKVVKEGSASKPVESTAPATKTIINEGNQLANRWKKLAGLLD
jgi:hypothetical protein